LHLAHGETERPREGGKIIKDVIGKICTMHLRDDIVVVNVGSVLEECGTVDVEGRCREVELISPVATSGITRNDVERLNWVVEVAEIEISISLGG